MSAAAFEAVPELLEHMLLQLPLPDILLAQQVSRTWNALIKNSPTLQRALFLRPSHDIQMTEVGISAQYLKYTCGCMNKAIRKSACLLPWPIRNHPPDCKWASTSDGDRGYHIVLNPFLAAFPWKPKQVKDNDGVLEVDRFPAKVFSDASWRNMLITQPPLKELVVEYWRGASFSSAHYHRIHAKPGSRGITFDDLRFHAKVEENARYVGSRCFNIVQPTAGRVVVCTGQDVTFELQKNDGAGDSE